MLMHPTIEKLESLRFTGMTKAFKEQSELYRATWPAA